MADAPELEFLQRTLVDAGLLPPERLEAWRRQWAGSGSFFAHLVELGALERPAANTLSAVLKGYVKLPPAGLLGLLKLEAQVEPERPTPAPQEERAERSAGHAQAERPAPAAPQAVQAQRSSGPQRSALAVALDAALSGLPMEPTTELPVSTLRPRPALPQLDEFVAGYQLRALLGQGARGAVYRAWAAAQGRSVVLKLMRAQDQGGLASAAAQAAVHGRVRHPGVLKIVAVGEEEPLTYLVFEDLQARGLAEYVDEAGPLAPAEVAQLGVEVAQTLAAAAAVGVVHGDLKPAHVLVYGDELRVKLTDFVAPDEGPPGGAYLAPERLASARALDTSGDMYSLGAILHHAATGRAPSPRAQPLAELGFPPALSAVVARLMHARPGERFASWEAANTALLGAAPAAGRGRAMSRGTGEGQA